jgi:CubicO group peptidase (beta-lactamase class C family)
LYYNQNGPGAAILVVYDGEKIINKGYGLRNIISGQPITPSTNLRSASLAKQFTDLGILSLVENGKINLEDTVFKYIPFIVFKDITIEQLISHTSGIEDAEKVFYDTWKSEKFVENQDIIDWYKSNNLNHFTPGTQFEYNNAAYCVLAKIIELNSGISYRDYIKNVVFDKVGMARTGFIDMAKPQAIEEKALCYEKDSTGIWQPMEGHFMDNLIGPKGIYINLNDYYRYIEALRGMKILKPETHELIFKPISMDIELHSMDMRILKGKKSSYCMGWEVTDSIAVSAGHYNGVNNWVIFELERPLTIVILTNNTLLFDEKLVDKTYNIIDKYIKTASNK